MEYALLPGFGKRKGQNIVSKLKNVQITEAQAIKCAMVQGISESNGQKLIDHFGSLDEFLFGSKQGQIKDIQGFGEILANKIEDEFPKFIKMFELLKEVNVTIKPEAVKMEVQTKGNIVMTGKCLQYGRKELGKILEDKGWTIQSGINKDTNVLLTDNPSPTSSKGKKAYALGIAIRTYNQIFEQEDIS
jgi:NAD-dependent DNA ligase